MITTSNFTMLTHIRHPLSIAMSAPRWYRCPTMKELSPSYNLLKEFKTGIIQADEFRFRYEQNVLQNFDPWDLLNMIKERVGLPKTTEENISLLSYEKPGVVSHRHYVADYINAVLPEDQWIKELSIRDCMIDKQVVKHLDVYKSQIPYFN